MTLNLPVHPRLRHPLTGEPLQAIYVDKHGRARWPVVGAAPDDPPKDPPKDPPNDPPSDPPKDPPADPPKDPPSDPSDKDLGFPKDTPVAEMSYEQQAAYHRYHSRKHEQRHKQWRDVFGDKTPEQAKADRDELEELRRGKRTESENAVEDAKKTAREEVTREYGTKLVRAEFRAALKNLEGVDQRDGTDKRDRIIDGLNLADYLTDSGDVATDKVNSYAADIAPADTGAGGHHADYGGGPRNRTTPSGVGAGRDLYAESRGKK